MRNRKDDIFIGEDQWIKFISLEGRYELAIETDQFLEDLWPLVQNLETHCVAECCGFEAFDFTPEAIHSAMRGMNRSQLLRACKQAQEGIAAVDSTVVVSARMNNLADKAVMLQLVGHIESCIQTSPAKQDGAADRPSRLD